MSCRRLTKTTELNSNQINIEIGAFVADKFGKKVKLNGSDLDVGIEIIDDKSYVFVDSVKCLGGIPVGVGGKVVVLVEDKKSLLAGLLMMKRGCNVRFVGFEDKDLEFVDRYCFGDVEFTKLRDVDEFLGLAKKYGVLVVGQNLSDFKEMDLNCAVLRPLIGFTDDEVEQLLSEYES